MILGQIRCEEALQVVPAWWEVCSYHNIDRYDVDDDDDGVMGGYIWWRR